MLINNFGSVVHLPPACQLFITPFMVATFGRMYCVELRNCREAL